MGVFENGLQECDPAIHQGTLSYAQTYGLEMDTPNNILLKDEIYY